MHYKNIQKYSNIKYRNANSSNWRTQVSPVQKKVKKTIFYIWNLKADTFQSNPMFKNLFGISPKTFADVKEFISKNDFMKLEYALTKSQKKMGTVRIPLRMKTKNQVYSYFMMSFGWIDEDTILGTFEHIQFKKQEYGDEHERRQFALEAAEAGLWDWDTVTNEVYYDHKYITMLGYSPSNFKQNLSSWADKVHPDDYSETVKKQLAYIKSPKYGNSFTCKYRFLNAQDKYIWIHGRGKIIGRDATGKASRMVGLHTDITEEEEAKIQIEFMLTHDILTALHNRNYFETQFIKNDVQLLPAAYILIDADGLKMLNDCVSHAIGDKMLQKLADTLRFFVRSSDVLARIGGDEFAIFLPRTENNKAVKIVDKLRKTIQKKQENHEVICCASIGFACATNISELANLDIEADISMRAQKKIQKPESFTKIKSWIESFTGRCYDDYSDERI